MNYEIVDMTWEVELYLVVGFIGMLQIILYVIISSFVCPLRGQTRKNKRKVSFKRISRN